MPETQTPPVVKLKGVTKDYRQGSLDVHALRGIDLTVHVGEFLALCGPSGPGKTTVLNLKGAGRPTA